MHNYNYFRGSNCYSNLYYDTFNIWNILLIVGIILLITGIIMYMTKKNQEQDNALDELKIRYVKGEINEDEFLSKKKVLEEK